MFHYDSKIGQKKFKLRSKLPNMIQGRFNKADTSFRIILCVCVYTICELGRNWISRFVISVIYDYKKSGVGFY